MKLTGNNPANTNILDGTIRAADGNVQRVLIDTGNMRGRVIAENAVGGPSGGTINEVTLTNGSILATGSSTGNSTINALGDLSLIQAFAINTQIVAGFGGNQGRLRQVTTTDGDLAGSISAYAIGPAAQDTLSLSVGGALTAAITTTLAGGITRQALVNTRNTVSPASAWTGAVTLGGTSRFAIRPFYTELDSQIGGEPIGVVPFGMHLSECTPPHNAPDPIVLINNQIDPLHPIVIEFYGPVRRDPVLPNAAPAKIERRIDLQGGAEDWIDVTKAFTYTIVGRELRIGSNQSLPTGCYRVTPIVTNVFDNQNPDAERSRLLCDQITGNVLVGTNTNNVYRFALSGGTPMGGPCVADVDDGTFTGTPDGGVTIDDLLYYLQIFQEGNILADIDNGSFTGCPDQGVTIDDLLYYIYRFEQGC